MIRKLLLPVACAALLGGCVTGYGYNDGGYYYGRPSSSVRYYGGASYGYPYGYGHDYGYGYGRYGYGYPYGGYYGGGYPYYRHHYCGDGHDHNCDRDDDDDHHGGGDHDGDNDRPPWRRWADDRGDINKRRVEVGTQPAVRMATPGQRSRAMSERPASVPRVAAPPRPVERVERRAVPRMSAPERPRNRQERDLRREQER